jgi:hypothetical protein
MKLILVFFSVLFLALLSNSHQASAQVQGDSTSRTPAKYRKSFWGDLGLGWGGAGNAFNISLSYEIVPRRFLSMRYLNTLSSKQCEEVVIFIPAPASLGTDTHAFEVAYGFLKKNRYSLSSISFGISYVTVQESGGTQPPPPAIPGLFYSNCPADYHTTEKNTAGASIMAQFIPCARWGGLGMSTYVNVNSKKVFAMFTINMAFGRMRPRNS